MTTLLLCYLISLFVSFVLNLACQIK